MESPEFQTQDYDDDGSFGLRMTQMPTLLYFDADFYKTFQCECQNCNGNPAHSEQFLEALWAVKVILVDFGFTVNLISEQISEPDQ